MRRLLSMFNVLVCAHGFMLYKLPHVNYTQNSSNLEEMTDVGEPLYLTPLLEEENIETAQRLSRVYLPGANNTTSYAGYFTVGKECGSNLFFWFFAAEQNWEEAPVVLWLQGGPGVSSMFGLFDELGPFSFDGGLRKRQYSWNINSNLLFIDQPVGTGFSFTRNECYVTNETEVGRDLYSALVQFYQLFPSLQENKLYIAGESYAGHYVPSIGYAIHKNNPTAKTKINLSGLLIGNGIMDELYQADYGNILYELGMIDNQQRTILDRLRDAFREDIYAKDWESAFISLGNLNSKYPSFIGNVSIYNYLRPSEDILALTLWDQYIIQPSTRKALKVGNNMFIKVSEVVFQNLQNDYVMSSKPQIEELLENYPMVFYYGHLDIICNYPMAVNFFENLDWSGTDDYLKAERQQWCVNDELAGYIKSAHNLHEVMVRNADHMVPKVKPLWAFDLVNSVIASTLSDPLRDLRICESNTE